MHMDMGLFCVFRWGGWRNPRLARFRGGRKGKEEQELMVVCSGCEMAANGMSQAQHGATASALVTLAEALKRTPSLAPAWRSLLWLESASPRNDYALQMKYAREAARSSTAEALCLAALNGTVDDGEAARAIMGLYANVAPSELCHAVRTKHSTVAESEVATFGLGPSLCNYPGMASGDSRLPSPGERFVDLVKRESSGYDRYVAAAAGSKEAIMAWDIGYIHSAYTPNGSPRADYCCRVAAAPCLIPLLTNLLPPIHSMDDAWWQQLRLASHLAADRPPRRLASCLSAHSADE